MPINAIVAAAARRTGPENSRKSINADAGHFAARLMFDKHEAEQKAKEAATESVRPLPGKEAW